MFSSLNPGHVGIQVSLRDGLRLAERHGFGGYDAQLKELHDEITRTSVGAVRDLFIRHGLRIGAWNVPFIPYRVTEEAWRNWLDILPQMVASADLLGARRAAMWIMPGSDEYEFDANFAFHVARFQPIARLLADHNVRLGLEFIGPETSLRNFKHPFIRSVKETLVLAEAIGPNCGLVVDSWHWHSVGGIREDLRGLTRDQLVHIHINDAPEGVALADLIDNRRKLPAVTGVIDLDGFMQALADAGYDGPVTAEPFDPEVSALPQAESAALTARATRNAVARAVRTKELGAG